MARLLLGVSGGIAAYKALEMARLAVLAGHGIRVVQTEASQRFVGRASFEAITGAPVLVGEFDRDPARGAFPDQAAPDHDPISHLEVVANADVYLVAPCSANTLAKLAGGLADNLLTTAALAATCPLVVAPAMNAHMWAHPATRANARALRERGATVLEPGAGALASKGEWGAGRLPEPGDLLAACEAALAAGGASADLAGVRVLVTAGGTREPIDAVRYVGNRSSGRMGWALAEEAVARGARVTVVAANVELPGPPGAEVVVVATAAELARACDERFDDSDVLLMAAAVSDFRPSIAATEKLKKAGREHLDVRMEPTPDVLSGLAARRRAGQTLVGFAAEHGEDALGYGREKLERKGLDAVVVNDVSRADIGFGAPDNEITIVAHDGERAVARAAKAEIARAVLDEVTRLRQTAEHGAAGAAARTAG